MGADNLSIYFIALSAVIYANAANAAQTQYHVEPEGSFIRGNLWIGDGLAGVYSSNASPADRFRIGGEIHLGDDYQLILGMVFLDRIWSGETSSSVGDISRRGTDFEFGYFFVPDKFWAMYTLILEDLSGSAVIGMTSTVAHQASIGYRFYRTGSFNLALEAAYIISPSFTASTYNFATGASGTAMFPTANIWSLNLRVGFDIGEK